MDRQRHTVVGAGIIGLATARAIAVRHPGDTVVVARCYRLSATSVRAQALDADGSLVDDFRIGRTGPGAGS
jgi:glycine/D-amino acid oxidase-like deaminating enzyme